MSRLDGKTALITGAASGIGRASAERMASEGAAIMCADIDGDGAEQTALTIEQRGGRAAFLFVYSPCVSEPRARMICSVCRATGSTA